MHGPHDAIQAAAGAGRQLVDHRSARVEHLDLQLAEQVPGALVVGDDRAVLRVVAHERRGAVGPAPLRLDALLRGACRHEGGVLRGKLRRQLTQRRDVVHDPDAAAVRGDHEVAVARLHGEIAHRDGGQMPAPVLRPVRAAVHRHRESQLRAEVEELRVDGILLDHVRVTAHTLSVLRIEERRPGATVILGDVDIRRHVPERVPVEGCIRRARRVLARLNPVHPAVLRQPAHVPHHVLPVPAAVARQLQVAVVGADPDEAGGERGLADREDRGVHLRHRVVDRDAAGFLLLLLLRIVAGEVGRDALPRLAVIVRAEQELRPDIDRRRVVRRERDGRIPVEAQLLVALQLLRAEARLDIAGLVGVPVDAADEASLVLGIHVIGIGRVLEHPEPVAAEHVLPARARDAARVGRIAHPARVVLQPAVDAIRVAVVDAHVIELRDRQIVALPPSVAAVVRDPQPAVVAREHVLGVVGIDPQVVQVAVHAVEAADDREALAAVLGEDQVAVGLEDALGVPGIDDQVGEVERPPHHPLTLVAPLPAVAAVVRDEEPGVGRLDEGVGGFRLARRKAHRDASVGFRRQPLAGGRRELGPARPAVGAAVEPAARRRLRALAARSVGPAPAAEVPERGDEDVGTAGLHRDVSAAGREIPALEHQLPGLAAVRGPVQAPIGRVAPELAGYAGVDGVRGARIDEDPRDALGLRQPREGPGLPGVGGLVDAVADRDAVARPGLAGADPDVVVMRRVDGDGADRLDRLLVEHRLEGGRAVSGLPHSPARCADEQRQLPRPVGEAGERRDAPAHRRRSDVARTQTRNRARVDRGSLGRGDCGAADGAGHQAAERCELQSHGLFSLSAPYFAALAGAAGNWNSRLSAATFASAFSTCTLTRSLEPFGPDSTANGT